MFCNHDKNIFDFCHFSTKNITFCMTFGQVNRKTILPKHSNRVSLLLKWVWGHNVLFKPLMLTVNCKVVATKQLDFPRFCSPGQKPLIINRHSLFLLPWISRQRVSLNLYNPWGHKYCSGQSSGQWSSYCAGKLGTLSWLCRYPGIISRNESWHCYWLIGYSISLEIQRTTLSLLPVLNSWLYWGACYLESISPLGC